MEGLILSAGCTGEGRRPTDGWIERHPRVSWMSFFLFLSGGTVGNGGGQSRGLGDGVWFG